MNQKNYQFLFRADEISFLFAEYLISGKGYGDFDYLFLLEKQGIAAYLSGSGFRQYYELGKNLIDKSFTKKLFAEIDNFIETLKKIKCAPPISGANLASAWSQAENHYQEFVRLYGMCENPLVAPLEDMLMRKAKDKTVLVEMLNDKKLVQAMGLNALEKHSYATIMGISRRRYQIHQNILPLMKLIDRIGSYLAHGYQLTPLQIFSHNREEFINLLEKGQAQNIDILDSRAQGTVFLKTKNRWRRSEGKEFIRWKNRLEENKPLSGEPVYPGVVTGKVKIHLEWISAEKDIPRNTILVSGMTSPHMVPFLKKVKGIITDEGGLTCHAAIIARELKIPAIVGTGNATQVLKDGDTVELDARRGIIKILAKAK